MVSAEATPIDPRAPDDEGPMRNPKPRIPVEYTEHDTLSEAAARILSDEVLEWYLMTYEERHEISGRLTDLSSFLQQSDEAH